MRLFLVAIGITLAASFGIDANAQGKGSGGKVPPAPDSVVVDANGKTIGPYLLFAEYSGAIASINGRIVWLPLATYVVGGTVPDTTKMAPRPYKALYFIYEGCGGDAYISNGSESGSAQDFKPVGFSPLAVLGADQSGSGTAYIGTSASWSFFTAASVLTDSGCSNRLWGPSNFSVVVDVVSLPTLWAAPYAVK